MDLGKKNVVGLRTCPTDFSGVVTTVERSA